MIDFDQFLQTDVPLFLFLTISDRMHVINSLPLVWMLDGRIITCEYKRYTVVGQCETLSSFRLVVFDNCNFSLITFCTFT